MLVILALSLLLGWCLLWAIKFIAHPTARTLLRVFVGFCLSAVMFFVVQSIIFLYPASRLKGVALAGGLGFVNACGLLGGFVGPSVMGAIEMSTGNAMNGLKVIALVLVVAALAALRLRQGQEEAQTSNAVGNPEASTR